MYKEELKVENRTAVPLKFPNVRLHLHDLIFKNKQLPFEAMINSAFHFGLLDEQSLQEINFKPGDKCLCMDAAAQIIEQHLKSNHDSNGQRRVDFSQIWQGLLRAAESHFKTEIMTEEHQGEVCIRTHDCYQFAPKLFDLMLQQLLRYPGLG